MRPWPRLQALTIRASLVLGFGLVLGLWLLTGYSFTQQFSTIQSADSAFNDRYLRAQQLLAEMRGEVVQGTVAARNAVIESEPAVAKADRTSLAASIANADTALSQYPLIFDTPAERERLALLADELHSFTVRMQALVRTEPERNTRTVRDLLDRDIAMPRDRMTSHIDDVQAANRAEFVAAQRLVTDRYNRMQRNAVRQLGGVLAASGLIALLAIVYAGRLEGRLRRQRAKEARTAEELQQLSARLITAQEDERRSIARELHDEIGQALMAIKVEIAYTQRAIATTGGPSQLLDEAQTITDGVLRSVRDLSQLLSPPLLEDMGLAAAVDWLVTGFRRRYPIEVELRTDELSERLPQEIETAAYRIIQEALTNVAKHAEAGTCRVHIRREAERLIVTVEDDGRGFEPEAITVEGTGRGIGLIGIRERVARLHGRLTINSASEAGTQLRAELPL
jgi:signal transduction histidine kinase